MRKTAHIYVETYVLSLKTVISRKHWSVY